MRFLPVVAAFVVAASAFADTVHLKNGSSMEGRVVSEDGDTIPVKLATGGEIDVKRADVVWIDPSDKTAASAEFEKRRKAASDADGLVEVGEWALFHGMTPEARAAFNDALKKDPESAGAHEGLGHRYYQDKWVTGDEYMAATGHVKSGGKWISKEEAEALAKKKEEAKKPAPKAEAKPVAKPAAGGKDRLHSAADDAGIMKAYGGAGWRIYSGERYRLLTNAPDPDKEFDRKFVESMDAFWATYCDTFGVTPDQKKLHNIILWDSRESYNAWCHKNAPAGEGAFGVYLHDMPFSPACLGYRGALRDAQYTGRHEGGHQFIYHYLRRDGGPWFHEGVAAMFECATDMPSLAKYPYRWDAIKTAAAGGAGDVSLHDLIQKSQKLGPDQTYSIGAAVNWFFLTGKGGAYKKAYQQFMAKGDIDSPESLEKLIGKGIKDLDAEYRAFVKEMDGKK